ncbi:hypothetical protein NM208_g7457 [Fusarium decemcellulare]|uniref:Uncharacterized protein n=1 Tax=Fusarium decemcellulare TaxID=57161 RepID=A0ACC1S9I3_9HYPO|nr:hypothetical protein NM208_g7457 [Fusarium decemcellulare]
MPQHKLAIFPAEVLNKVWSFMDASGLDGISKSSKAFRDLLIPQVFYAVRFDGTEKGVSTMLGDFLHSGTPDQMQQIWNSVRKATIVTDLKMEGNEIPVSGMEAELMPRLMQVIQRMPHVRVLRLDLSSFRRQQTNSQTRQLLETSPRWPTINTVRIDYMNDLSWDILVNQCLGENITALHFDNSHSRQKLEVVKEHCPNLKRLFFCHLGSVLQQGDPEVIQIGRFTVEFAHLEWLIIDQSKNWTPDRRRMAQTAQGHLIEFNACVMDLIAAVLTTPSLRKLAVSLHKKNIDQDIVRQVHIPGSPLTEAELNEFYTDLTHRTASSLPHLDEFCIMDDRHSYYRAVTGADGSVEVRRETVEEGQRPNTFPFGVLDD